MIMPKFCSPTNSTDKIFANAMQESHPTDEKLQMDCAPANQLTKNYISAKTWCTSYIGTTSTKIFCPTIPIRHAIEILTPNWRTYRALTTAEAARTTWQIRNHNKCKNPCKSLTTCHEPRKNLLLDYNITYKDSI